MSATAGAVQATRRCIPAREVGHMLRNRVDYILVKVLGFRRLLCSADASQSRIVKPTRHGTRLCVNISDHKQCAKLRDRLGS